MTRGRRFLWVVFLVGSLLIPLEGRVYGTGPTRDAFPRGELEIQTRGGRHRFSVELALTAEQQALGLMYRAELPDDAGMLFVHPQTRPTSMWMKNTLLPLDMLFLAADGTIVRIAEETEPLSTRTIPSGEPVKGVLELRGGTVRRLGIEPGDRVLHPLFGPTP
jgi:uncharacterized membrane protein (UPF0127 family)